MNKIYVLLCEGNRYYIGKTERKIEKRIEEHFRTNGSYWTKKYKPLKVVETIQSNDKMDEDKYTKKYMLLYGVENVRGGTYTEMILPEYKLKCLQDELCTIDDLCFKCKRSGHFANECYAKTTIDGDLIESEDDVWCCDYCADVFNNKREAERHEELCLENCKRDNLCFRCGRNGHYANNCYAKTTIDGDTIESEEEYVWCCNYCAEVFDNKHQVKIHEKTCKKKKLCKSTCFRCKRVGHIANECYAKTTIDGNLIESEEKSKDGSKEICDRCGRNGHAIINCYAKRTVNGLSTDVVDVVNVVNDVGKAASWLLGKITGK